MSDGSFTVEYREIPEFAGYRVGSDGTIWSRRKRGSYAVGLNDDWRKLTPASCNKGYLRVQLYRGDGRSVRRMVHHLVLEAFVGSRPAGMEGCHGNGNPGDNSVRNLRWDTQQGNWQDRIRHGNDCRGEKNRRAKLTSEAVSFIRENHSRYSRRELAERFGVTRQLVTLVLNGKCWTWLKES